MPKKKNIKPDVEEAEVVEASDPVPEAQETDFDEAENHAVAANSNSLEANGSGDDSFPDTDSLSDHEDHEIQADESDEHGFSLSARVLQGLALMALGGAVALWGAPKLAPVLPNGLAPIARFLMPGQSEALAEIDTLRADIQSQIDALAAIPKDGVSQAEIDKAIADYDVAISNRLGAIKNQLGATDGQEIEARLSKMESRLTGITAKLSTMSERLSLQITENGAALSEKAAAKLAGYQVVIDGLKAQVEELAATSGALGQKIDAASKASARRLKEAEDAATSKIATSTTNKLITDISYALDSGAPFKSALDRLAKITSVSAPTALLDIAATGTTNWTELRRQFPDAAHAALRADTQASAQTGVFGKLGAFLKNQIGTRSLQRQEGNTTDAILSRIEDELVRGNLETTRTEADALPESAKAAISGWLTDLEHLTAAQSALAQLSSTLGVAN